MASKFEQRFAALYKRWSSDLFIFAREAMNFDFHSQQEALFRLVMLESKLPISKRKKRIAVKSGQGPGKTAATVIIALWRCIRYEDALVIVTAPSMRQCKQWVDEARRLLKDAHPELRAMVQCYGTKIEINGKSIWGVKTATATRPENLQGIHEKRLTFIADEASGVSRGIIETIKGTLTNPDALFIQIGNPNTTDCAFYDCFTTQRSMWHTLTFNAEETAMERPDVCSPDRNRQLAAEYGRDSDVYRVRVLGEFPKADPNSVFDLAALEFCTRTNLVNCASFRHVLPVDRAISLDFARYGSDEGVVAVRQGLAITDFQIFVKKEPRVMVDYAFNAQLDRGWANDEVMYVPDMGGMGQGVYSVFPEAGRWTHGFLTNARPFDVAMYADMNSEAWFLLRGLVRDRICRIPNDARLLQQLSTRQYYMNKKGQIQVESKDEWKKRTEIDESPDRADAVVMAFYAPSGMSSAGSFELERGDHIVGTSARKRR